MRAADLSTLLASPAQRARARRRLRPGLEGLEGRWLLSGGLTEYPITPAQFPGGYGWDGQPPIGVAAANGRVIPAADGTVWFEVNVPQFTGNDLTVLARLGPDGVIANEIGVENYLIPPGGLTTAPDGSLWITEQGWPNFLLHATASGQVGTMNLPFHPLNEPGGVSVFGIGTIVYGPDSNLWFTDSVGAIDRVTPGGQFAQFMPPHPGDPTARGSADNRPLVVGPDGALWFTEPDAHQIARITTSGAIIEYPLPEPYDPVALASTGGALWFAQQGSPLVGRMATDGTVMEFVVPSALGVPTALAGAPDGSLVIETDSGQFARVTADGTITALPLPKGVPKGLAVGPDGAIWFADATTGALARFQPDGAFEGSGESVAGTAGQPVSAPLAVFSAPADDIQAGAVTATIDWGDGHTSAGMITANGVGSFVVQGANTYAQDGTFAVHIQIDDANGGASFTTAGTATIATPTPPTKEPGGGASGNTGSGAGAAPVGGTTAPAGQTTAPLAQSIGPASGPTANTSMPNPASAGTGSTTTHVPLGPRAQTFVSVVDRVLGRMEAHRSRRAERFLARADRALHRFEVNHPQRASGVAPAVARLDSWLRH